MDKLFIIFAVVAVLAIAATIAICNDVIIRLQQQLTAQREVIRTLEEQVIKLQHKLFEQQQHESPDDRTNFDA